MTNATAVPLPWPGSLACLVACAMTLFAGQASAANPALTLDQYRAALDSLAAAIADSRPVPALPDAWQVQLGDSDYSVETGPLARDLQAWRATRDPQTRMRLLQRVDALRSEATAAARAPIDPRAEHARLASILAAPEFQNVADPTWWDRLRQAMIERLQRLFSTPLISSSFSTLGPLAIYAFIALAVALGAWVAFRYIEGLERVDTVLSIEHVPVREWQQWLADARAAAEVGAWREATHFTYWCAVSFLEARGSWRPDHTRTPREYLRLLPVASRERATLAELTTGFERVWYGTADADAQTYALAMTHLQTIGCPLA